LFRVIRDIKEKGISILYVSHKLEEVKEISDRITILRDGAKVRTARNEDITKEEIVESMIGRRIGNYFHKKEAEIGGNVLSAQGLSRRGLFENVSFHVRKGEVLGFYGLLGAGRSDIAETIFGVCSADSGSVYLDERRIKIRSSTEAIKHGVCLVPEDRKNQGLILKLDVRFNMTIAKIRELNRFGHILRKKEKETAEGLVGSLNIKTPFLRQTVSNLSGGNQQKVVVAKWLAMKPKVLILDEPTRGIDIGAKSEIYSLISDLAHEGVAVIVISSELPEIMGICDRVIIVSGGRITGAIEKRDFDSSVILRASLGERPPC